MKELSLNFAGLNAPELIETSFSHPLNQQKIRSVRGASLEGAHVGTFSWSKGVKALSILLLRQAEKNLEQKNEEMFLPYILSGQAGSPAASLDDSIAKMPAWMLDMFGMTARGEGLIKHLIVRNNPQRKRPGPVKLALRNPKELKIRVFLNNELLSSQAGINRIADAIECDWQPKTSLPGPCLRKTISARKRLLVASAAA